MSHVDSMHAGADGVKCGLYTRPGAWWCVCLCVESMRTGADRAIGTTPAQVGADDDAATTERGGLYDSA